MPKKFEKKFLSYCKSQDLEINPNQIGLGLTRKAVLKLLKKIMIRHRKS